MKIIKKWVVEDYCCQIMGHELADETITVSYDGRLLLPPSKDGVRLFINYCNFCGEKVERVEDGLPQKEANDAD